MPNTTLFVSSATPIDSNDIASSVPALRMEAVIIPTVSSVNIYPDAKEHKKVFQVQYGFAVSFIDAADWKVRLWWETEGQKRFKYKCCHVETDDWEGCGNDWKGFKSTVFSVA